MRVNSGKVIVNLTGWFVLHACSEHTPTHTHTPYVSCCDVCVCVWVCYEWLAVVGRDQKPCRMVGKCNNHHHRHRVRNSHVHQSIYSKYSTAHGLPRQIKYMGWWRGDTNNPTRTVVGRKVCIYSFELFYLIYPTNRMGWAKTWKMHECGSTAKMQRVMLNLVRDLLMKS